jgi:hypothetical protein
MKVVYSLFLISVMGLFATASAQNTSNDEVDVMIRELIQECHDKVMVDEHSTEAEKTVAKRNCETDITNQYKNVEINYQETAEKRANIKSMQKCEDWHPQYRYLTEEQFRLQKHEVTVTDCIIVYNDSIWEYDGVDRLEKLSARLLEIKAEAPKAPETRHVELDINIPKLQSNLINTQQDSNATDLEEKIRILEEELIKKDAIINEQIKVIMELANRIKNVMFSPFSLFFTQF